MWTVDPHLHAFWELHVNTRVGNFRILHNEESRCFLALIIPLCSKSDCSATRIGKLLGDVLVQITNDEPVTPLGIALSELTTHCGNFEEKVLLSEGVVTRETSLNAAYVLVVHVTNVGKILTHKPKYCK